MLRKKDLPKEVEVADGIFYAVKFKRGLQKRGYDGLCFYDLKEIWIAAGMTMENTLVTLEHEILHAIAHEWDFQLYHPMIKKLEEPLAFFRQRNTIFIQWQQVG